MLAQRSRRACNRVSERSRRPMSGRISPGLGSRRSTMVHPPRGWLAGNAMGDVDPLVP
jgi:hypothetical protein